MDPKPSPLASHPAKRSRLEYFAYAAFCGLAVLVAARPFYDSLKLQLFYSWVRGDPYLLPNDWSAPLDDVFIHFDFARSAARGHPFEWVPGNGYSSGGTSLLYPLVLAPGFRLGFTGSRMMEFAALVAETSVLSCLLSSRRLFRFLPTWASYLAPPFLLSVGALDWSLWSGMEVAFFLALWGLTLVAWDDLVNGPPEGPDTPQDGRRALVLGLANALLVATRPEAFVIVAVFGLSAAWTVLRRRGSRAALGVLVAATALAALVVVASAVANRVLTGDWSAAGALVKLEIYDPRLTRQEVWDAWFFHVRYQIARVTGYHVADGLVRGSLIWVLAALPLAFQKTRRFAVVLWLQAILWVMVVALNGQVRWQNERYTMPALAWMLLSAALGVGAVFTHPLGARPRERVHGLLSRGAVCGLLVILATGQVSRMRDQVWFFGRASRNIRDQHVKAARRIRHEIPSARRVLVGDAGAIPYASDLPALDIIGLGGYPGLPFARASRWGVAAAIELIERIPPSQRPDVMAIYPTWWGDFPLWFGKPIDGVTVRGNVICGGLTKMLYEARWGALDGRSLPGLPLEGRRVADDIDFADVLSEQAHALRVAGAPGFVAMKLLAHPSDPKRELWDAGRVVPPGASLSFRLLSAASPRGASLLLRTAPTQPARVRVVVGGEEAGSITLKPEDAWVESTVPLPAGRARPGSVVTLSVERNEVILYHAWSVQAP